MPEARAKADYGVDAPAVMRNLFLAGILCVLLALFTPRVWRFGSVKFALHGMFWCMGVFLLAQGCLFLSYVKYGKFKHRDFMLAMHTWRGDERVLDVGCGRGLLLVGAAKKLVDAGRGTGLDHWSNVDMAANSATETQRNLSIESVTDKCTLVSGQAQQMPFADGSFEVVVSNLCLHNIEDTTVRRQALMEIDRVLAPSGVALISDYKHTGEYAEVFRELGCSVSRRWGSIFTTFPPLRVVIARKG